ncbi:carbamoyltransferase C-terminal domain-containing protein [Streptomyces pilosus]|uniref:Carbamoyltransferase C-terminal domain-containing protein n=1 Tax=Streptomyces pilosus TaxID=28893 RepID=A0A918C3E6_9ACTN|nr:carbamoyltransferase C-terminal domain-containing protein [Streptomyces pilosus]GGR04811.1 hypothetical protein GCM10010280_61050 [Streptomyces pilosus]
MGDVLVMFDPSRCSTPKRCCSSTTTRPRSELHRKKTKRGIFLTLFSPFIGANVRRARLTRRGVKAAKGKLNEHADLVELKRWRCTGRRTAPHSALWLLARVERAPGYFAPPAASDRGQPLGCALYAWHRLTGELPRRPLSSDYFGRDYTSEEIGQALRRDLCSGLVERRRTPFTWRRESDIARTAAQMIADGKIIGWFQGGSELGPRALGARSILADPRTTASSDALNQRIKHREPFRPFAPAILADHASTWFDLDVPSPFMLLAPPVRPDHVDRIAGVVHVDGTARVQTVDPAAAPTYGELIEHFHQLTGVPVVLHTSFNDREPIVETPAHALATFQACDLDAACVGEYLVERS